MRKLTVVVAVLVVSAGLAAALSASAVGDRAPDDPTRESLDQRTAPESSDQTRELEAHESSDLRERDSLDLQEREPPELPEQWRRTYGAGGDDMFSDLVRTDDGGYLLVGWTERKSMDGWVVKVDSAGETEWSKTLGGPGTDRLWGVVGIDGSDGADDGYLLAGRTTVDGVAEGWVVELGPDGEVRKERTPVSGAFNAIAHDDSGEDSGYLLAGWTRDDGKEGLAMKLDENLSREWQTSYSTPDGYQHGYLRAVVPTEQGYYLAGKAEGDSADAWALKVDSDGGLAWQATAGGPERDDVWAAAPASLNSSDGKDGGFVLAGETGVGTDSRQAWLVKFGAEGDVEWERTPGSEGSLWLDSAMKTEDGYLFTGSSKDGPTAGTDGYVLKTDEAGNAQWERYYGTSGWDKPWPAIRAHGGGYLLAGQTSGDGATAKDGWLVRIGDGSESGETTVEGTATETNDRNADANDSNDDTTDKAMQSGTVTTENGSDAEGGVPGLGLGTALLAFAALWVAIRR